MTGTEWVHQHTTEDVLAAAQAETVQLDERHRIPKTARARFRNEQTGTTVEVVVDSTDGRPKVRSLSIEAGDQDHAGIDRDRLRAIPVGDLMRRCVAFGTWMRGVGDDEGWSLSNQTARDAARRVAPTGRPLADGDLAEVARVYMTHDGPSPTEAVATRFHLTPSGAAKRVSKARKAGLIPPTTPGKASNRKGER